MLRVLNKIRKHETESLGKTGKIKMQSSNLEKKCATAA